MFTSMTVDVTGQQPAEQLAVLLGLTCSLSLLRRVLASALTPTKPTATQANWSVNNPYVFIRYTDNL